MKGVKFVVNVRITIVYDGERGIMLIKTQKLGRFKRSDDIKNFVREWTCLTGLDEPDGYTSCNKILDYTR